MFAKFSRTSVDIDARKEKYMKYNAKDIVWIEYWTSTVDPRKENAAIQYEKNCRGNWECEIRLPLINVVVKRESNDLIKLVLVTARSAAKKINEYMKGHPELKIRNMFKGNKYELFPDGDRNDFTVSYSKRFANSTLRKNRKIAKKSAGKMTKLVNFINRKIGSTKDVAIHVMDQSKFGDINNPAEIKMNAKKYLKKSLDGKSGNSYFDSRKDSVIMIGFPPVKK